MFTILLLSRSRAPAADAADVPIPKPSGEMQYTLATLSCSSAVLIPHNVMLLNTLNYSKCIIGVTSLARLQSISNE